MIRVLIFLLAIVLFAGTATYLAGFESRITGEAFGYKFDGHSGLVTGFLLLVFFLAIYLTHKIKDILAMPARLKVRDKEKRRERGVAALTRGLEAVMVGDAADAAHHAKVARRHLDDMALTRLLSAQAAQLSGDEASAKESYSAMLEAPETEFMGLKGLYLQAMAKGDRKTARTHAERAFQLRSNARWAFDSVLELGLERGAWGETRDAVARAKRNHLIETDKADRATAALLTADAYAASAGDDKTTALRDVEAALKLAPSFAPAALLAAQFYADAGKRGKRGKAAKTVEHAFTASAHPALACFMDNLYKDEIPEKRAELLRKLAAKNSTAREAKLLEARAFVLLSDWKEAIATLEPLLTDGPTAQDYALMARAVEGLSGKEDAQIWLERAASAPRDPRPGAEGEFHFTRDGWARLVMDYMELARLAPPPLEDAAASSVTADEIRLLIAPKQPAPAVEDEPAGDLASKSEAKVDEVSAEEESDAPEVEKTTPTETSSEASEPAAPEKEAAMQSDEDAERIADAARKVS